MIRNILIIGFFVITSFAIEIQLFPDKKINVTRSDLGEYKTYIKKKYNYVITDNEGAKKLIRENRILANEFLKNGMYKKEKEYIKIMLEDYLADKYVQNIQRSIKIPEKVLYSYYLDNKEKFKKPSQVNIIRFRFKTYDDAADFYNKARTLHNEQAIKKLAMQHNAQIKDYGWRNVTTLKKNFTSFIKKNEKSYLIPPFIQNAQATNVYYIRDYKKEGDYYSFDKVKQKIRDILYAKTFEQKREEILKRYK